MTLTDIIDTPLLIYGIGNVGRQDDGAGPLLVERLEAMGVPDGVSLESGYQLVPEDAQAFATQAVVIFVDAHAAADAQRPYSLSEVAAAREVAFSTHAMSPGSVLALCQQAYGRLPRAYALAIPAYSFEVNAAPTAAAAEHVECAASHLSRALQALGRRRDRV